MKDSDINHAVNNLGMRLDNKKQSEARAFKSWVSNQWNEMELTVSNSNKIYTCIDILQSAGAVPRKQ